MVESFGQETMNLVPGKTKCYNFTFVARTEDVGKKIEVSCVCVNACAFIVRNMVYVTVGG